MPVDALTQLDLSAAVLRPAHPCQRRHCGGSVVSISGGDACHLCARPGGRDNAADRERELERKPGLRGLANVALGGGG